MNLVFHISEDGSETDNLCCAKSRELYATTGNCRLQNLHTVIAEKIYINLHAY